MKTLLKSLISIGVLSLLLSTSVLAKNDTASQLAQYMTGILDIILAEAPNLEGADVKTINTEFQQNFSKLLTERFSEKELVQINETMQMTDSVKITKMMIQAFKSISSNMDKMQDVNLNIPKNYDELLEKKFTEEKTDEKLKELYIKQHAGSKTIETDAARFVSLTKKHLKKLISEQFTEKQYRTYYDFEHSDLGKKFYDTFTEGLMMTMNKR